MDTKLEKKNSKLKIILISLLALTLVAAFLYYFFNQKKTFNVSKEDIRTTQVTQGKFEDMMMITAQTQSLNSTLVNVPEGGAVKEIYAEDGDLVQKGQPLARVYNANTEFNYMNQETSIMQQISQMRNSLLDLKNQEFAQQQELLQAQNDFNKATTEFNLQKRLYEAEIGKKTDYDVAQQNLEYQQKRLNLVQKGVANDKRSRQQQMAAVNKSINQMEKSLSVLRNNKNNFLITAPQNGRLSSFDISLGQNLTNGESIGKIDLMDGYKLVAKIDEYYINRLQPGVKGTLDFNEKSYDVIVTKVLPEVTNGQFEAELNFVEQKPKNLRIGMTFGVKLKLSQDTESLIITKGNFYKDTSGKWVYVVKNNIAEKRTIELGRENSLNYEVLSGLEAGEEVIVSGYEDFKDYEKLHINK